MSTNIDFVPEINYWALELISNSPVSQSFKDYPISINADEWRKDGSMLDLLFNYTFDMPTYAIHYRKVDRTKITDSTMVQRSYIHAGRLTFWASDYDDTKIDLVPDSTSSFAISTEVIDDIDVDFESHNLFDTNSLTSYNVFSITEGERDMLDLLLTHKQGFDVKPVLDQIIYTNLPSSLSKLIYIYLDVEVNDNYYLYDDSEMPVNTQDRLLTWLYEKFVLDHIYRRLKLGPSVPTGVNLNYSGYSNTSDFLTEDNITSYMYEFPSNTPPLNGKYIFFVHNGIYQELDKDYSYQVIGEDTTSPMYILNWSGNDLKNNAQIDDKIYLSWGYEIDNV